MNIVSASPVVENPIPAEVGSAELFSVMLSSFIPGERAVDVTHELRERFGSIPKAMRRRSEELRQVPGLCDTAAFVIDLLHQLYKEILREDLQREEPTFRSGLATRYCREVFGAEERDISKVFYLRAGRVVHEGPVSVGTIGSKVVYTREILGTALSNQASDVLVVFGRSHGNSILNEDELGIMGKLSWAAEPFQIGTASELVLTHM